VRVSSDTGFTIIEVLATLGLLGLLFLVALPQLTVPGTLDVAVLADQIASDLRLARQLAVSGWDPAVGRVNYILEFSPAAPPYTGYTVRNAVTSADEPDFPKEIPSNVAITGRQRFIFTPSGCVDDDGVGQTCGGTDGEVDLASGTDTARVRVFWYRGRIRVDQP